MQGFRDSASDNKCEVKTHTNDIDIQDCHCKGKSNKNIAFEQKDPQGSGIFGKTFDLS